MFVDCPAQVRGIGSVRCGLPAEVEDRYTMWSTDGPLECTRIRCPRGHWFNGPVSSVALSQQRPGWDGGSRGQRDGGPSAMAERFEDRAAVAGADHVQQLMDPEAQPPGPRARPSSMAYPCGRQHSGPHAAGWIR